MSTPDPAFFYLAAGADGSRKFGVRSAINERSLAEGLGRDRLILVRSFKLPKALNTAATGKLPLKDQAEIHTQFSQLVGRAVPVAEALEVVEQTVTKRTSPTIAKMRHLVSQGSSFADACEATGSFDATTTAVYRAAERSGDLAGAARQLTISARRQKQVREKATTALLYPAVVAMVGICVGVFFLVLVVPQVLGGLRSVVEGAGNRLPWYTELLSSLSDFLRTEWLLVSFLVAALAITAIIVRKPLVTILAGLLRKLPVAKDLANEGELARFFSVMSALARSGVPVVDALGIAQGSVSDPKLSAQVGFLRQGLIDGGVMRVLIERVDRFPIASRRLLIAAERSGDLDDALETLAGDHTQAVERQTERLLGVLEPALIVCLAAFIGGMVLAVMTPMLTITSSIG
jgi:type II secretory pathway component PulF